MRPRPAPAAPHGPCPISPISSIQLEPGQSRSRSLSSGLSPPPLSSRSLQSGLPVCQLVSLPRSSHLNSLSSIFVTSPSGGRFTALFARLVIVTLVQFQQHFSLRAVAGLDRPLLCRLDLPCRPTSWLLHAVSALCVFAFFVHQVRTFAFRRSPSIASDILHRLRCLPWIHGNQSYLFTVAIISHVHANCRHSLFRHSPFRSISAPSMLIAVFLL